MKRKLLLIAHFVLANVLACQAFEYWENWQGYKIKWGSDNPRIRASARGFPDGSTWRAALGDSVDQWNLNPSDFRFNLTYDDADVELGNDQSEIWWTDDDDALDGAPAVTYTWYSGLAQTGRYIEETDVLFNLRVPYGNTTSRKTRTWAYGGSRRPFQTTLMHELGHALGLAHENDKYTIMGTDWTHLNANGDALRFYPGEEACDGAVFLYTLNPVNLEDVSVTHWKRSGADGEYSTHVRTLITDTDDVALPNLAPLDNPTDTVFSDPIYRVSPGQQVKLEYTLENNGASLQTPLLHFLLSDDSWIGPNDTLLDTRRPTIGRNSVFTTTQTLTIPNNLAIGQTYYLGIIVDADNSIAEVREDNNATYIAIRVE